MIINFDQKCYWIRVELVISLCMVSLEKTENQNFEIAANTTEAGN